ncbi:hypothetical protein IWZ03DRAFT_379453 [Phyllosticta citriasiana]|uniref:Uncharacterized protein n=1 Tax=Phyllosticta citriasiana TaxID=595635 RepID=A0ABR1KI74_9PEZI
MCQRSSPVRFVSSLQRLMDFSALFLSFFFFFFFFFAVLTERWCLDVTHACTMRRPPFLFLLIDEVPLNNPTIHPHPHPHPHPIPSHPNPPAKTAKPTTEPPQKPTAAWQAANGSCYYLKRRLWIASLREELRARREDNDGGLPLRLDWRSLKRTV